MVSRLSNLHQEGEASEISPPPDRGGGSRKRTTSDSAFNGSSYEYGNPISRIVGASADRLTRRLLEQW